MSLALSIHAIVWLVALLALFAGNALVSVYWERKLIGRFQLRPGPLHNGFQGLLQLPADMIKMLGKEDTVPASADATLFQLAPFFAAVPAFVSFAALTFAPGAALVDMNHGLFFIFSVLTLLPLAFAVMGWSSDNKFALLGGLRAAAQLISYEIPMLLAALGVVLSVGSLRLTDIAEAQKGLWFVVTQPLGFAIFFVAMLADMNRTPFDLPEAESELVAGYHTEYSGIKFGIVQMSEYAVLFVGSYLVSMLFLGGWNMPWLPASPLWLLLKVALVISSVMWIRATFPRIRIDKLMEISWKYLLPASLVDIMLVSVLVLAFPKVF